MKKIVLFFLFLFFYVAEAQQTLDRSVYFNFGESFFSDYILSPSQSDDSLNIEIMFKISNSSLAYTQMRVNRSQRIFTSIPVVEIVFYDDDGIIRKRMMWSDTVFVEKYEETNEKFSYIHQSVSTTLHKNNYDVKISLLDNYNQRIEELNFNVKANINDENKFSNPFFTYEIDGIIRPVISNGNLNFASVTSTVYILNNTSDNFPIRIEKIQKENEQAVWEEKINYSNFLIPTDEIPTVRAIDNNIEVILENNNNNKIGFSKATIPSYQFVPGNYKMTIGNVPDTSVYNFKVIWQDKPLSLKEIDFAVKAMKYILTDEEYKAIDKGNEREKFNNIINYWEPKDPTPGTPYNEAMAEFYKRVDYSAFNFATLKEKDGVDTDKAKIYILYGPPSSIETILEDERNLEIWDYQNRVQKTFTFEMISAGIYRLIDIQDKSTGESN